MRILKTGVLCISMSIYAGSALKKVYVFNEERVQKIVRSTPGISHIQEHGNLARKLSGRHSGYDVVKKVNAAIAQSRQWFIAQGSDSAWATMVTEYIRSTVFQSILPPDEADELYQYAYHICEPKKQ